MIRFSPGSLGRSVEPGVANNQFAESHRAMIALDRQRTKGSFIDISSSSRPARFDVLVKNNSIVYYADEAGILGILSLTIEPRSPKADFELLPGSRRGGRVGGRRSSLESLVLLET